LTAPRGSPANTQIFKHRLHGRIDKRQVAAGGRSAGSREFLAGWERNRQASARPHSTRFAHKANLRVFAHPGVDRSCGRPYSWVRAEDPRPLADNRAAAPQFFCEGQGETTAAVSPQQAQNRLPPPSARRCAPLVQAGYTPPVCACPLFSGRIADCSGAGAGPLPDWARADRFAENKEKLL
jgi:hypothetical protein